MKHIRAEELFHLAKDGIEMNNVARQTPDVLATAWAAYDAELAAMKANVIQANGYELYPTIFDRVTPWKIKEPLLKREANKAGKTGTRSGPPHPSIL
jgi:hypothetical protein